MKDDSSKDLALAAARLEGIRRKQTERSNGTIQLTGKYTLEPIDERNWALCDDGEAFAYWSSLDQALAGVARRLLDRSIRASLSATTLQELANAVEQAKQVVVAELKRLRASQ